jgi:hypothetical protein
MPRRKRHSKEEIVRELLDLARHALDLAELVLDDRTFLLGPRFDTLTALMDSITKPFDAILRAIALPGINAGGSSKWMDEIAQIRAAMTEIENRLRPKTPGKKPKPTPAWATFFASWKRQHDETDVSIDDLIEAWMEAQRVPWEKFETISSDYYRWLAKRRRLGS